MTSTRGHWLPGDPRGFRSFRHKVHSSGDYRSPPPPDEHAGLLHRSRTLLKNTIELSRDQRHAAGVAMLGKLRAAHVTAAAIAVGRTHAHALVLVGDADAVALFGRAKQAASLALKGTLAGPVWGRSSHVVRVRSQAHGCGVKRYILAHAREDAWTWSHDDPDRAGPTRDG